MKRYILEVIIDEGSDEYWEEITKNKQSGCDDIRKAIHDSVWDAGFQDAKVNLIKFEDINENFS